MHRSLLCTVCLVLLLRIIPSRAHNRQFPSNIQWPNLDFIFGADDEDDDEEEKVKSTFKKRPYWPYKGGNLNRSGTSVYVGSFNFEKPSWVFEEPDKKDKGPNVPTMKVFYSTPVIDGAKNVYAQSTTGWVYSLDPKGSLRWSFETSDANPGNLVLHNATVYTVSQDGTAFAIDAHTGTQVWRNKVAMAAPDDTHSPIASRGLLVMACNPTRKDSHGAEAICALRTRDGRLQWTYSLLNRGGALAYNLMPSVVGGGVVFSDITGGVYRVNLLDGRELWYQPGLRGAKFSTAGLAVGPNNKIYNCFNEKPGRGTLRVHDLKTGDVLWSRLFHEEVNAAPAVGKVRRGGPLAVVIAVGNNLACTPQSRRLSWKVDLFKKPPRVSRAVVYVLDAQSGNKIWDFAAPPYNKPIAGTGWDNICCPDVFGTPTIGADGTVYVNWSGGYSYGLRDSNRNGRVNPHDKFEVTSYHHGSGTNGNTAIAPGLVVVPSCHKLLAYIGQGRAMGHLRKQM